MNKESKRLGRGLETLIPRASHTPLTSKAQTGSQVVALEELKVNPRQPRKHFDEHALAELADSVKEKGVLQPLLVRRMGMGFEIIAGERRFRAAKKVGLKSVPVHIVKMTDQEQLEAAIIENIIREDLSAIETARALAKLQKEFSLSQEDIAQRTGKSRSTVANLLRLFQLPESIQVLVEEKKITLGHAKALLAFSPEAKQLRLADLILEKKLSVRQVEAWTFDAPKKTIKTERNQNPNLRSRLEDIQRNMGTKVTLKSKGASKGEVVLQYHHESELEKILRQLLK